MLGDDVDPDFLAAIKGRDDAIEIDPEQLRKPRSYVLGAANSRRLSADSSLRPEIRFRLPGYAPSIRFRPESRDGRHNY